MKQKKEILELTSITKSYAGVTVLHNVDFSLNEGEIHCIVGENGAGKSTLIKILAGAVVPDYGEIKLFGQQCSYTSPQVPIDMGVATIYQDADLIESLTVADNVFLGDEKNRFGIVDRAQQIAQTKAIVDELELDLDPTVLVEKLSPGQKQLLQIVKALRRKARLIIMDEPTASLGEEATRMLADAHGQTVGCQRDRHHLYLSLSSGRIRIGRPHHRYKERSGDRLFPGVQSDHRGDYFRDGGTRSFTFF